MTSSPDVVVVGGGIVGLCVAIATADRGMHVTLVDVSQAGAASRASAGMLGASLPGLPASLSNLAFAARDLYPETIAHLADRTGIDVALDRNGILEIAASSAELEALHRRTDVATRLDQRALAELEPALATHAGAVHHPLDGWVDNRALMDALWVSAKRHPRIRLLRDRVSSIDVSPETTPSVLAHGDRIECRRIVLAAGAWADRLQGVPRRLSVASVKGELLTLDRCPVHHVVYGASGYIVPRGSSSLVGATSEAGSFDPTPTAHGRQFLLGVASTIVPTLSAARVVDHWGGLRPVSPDGLPILGEDELNPALVYACGFSRNGILLAPWAGNALSEALAKDMGAQLPTEFSPRRLRNQ